MAVMREQYVVDENGRRTAIILPWHRYQQLLEDLYDLAAIAGRKDEPTIDLDELKRRLRSDGFLPD